SAAVGKKLPALLGILQNDVEIVMLDQETELIFAGGKETLAKIKGEFVPTLTALDMARLKRVVVDMGAVPHLANGADVMAPGIVFADDGIKAGEIVEVSDERHAKPIAVGLALVDGTQMKGGKGRAVKNIHHVGDKIWKALRKG
ncbi:MAG: PUA domain-containing protein, partial [Candidatus Zixiibacteriota bacterium]